MGHEITLAMRQIQVHYYRSEELLVVTMEVVQFPPSQTKVQLWVIFHHLVVKRHTPPLSYHLTKLENLVSTETLNPCGFQLRSDNRVGDSASQSLWVGEHQDKENTGSEDDPWSGQHVDHVLLTTCSIRTDPWTNP